MIIVNNASVIENEEHLNEFIQYVQEESYNDMSEKVCQVIEEYLRDVWERDIKLTKMVHKKISRSLYPVELVDLTETGDWKNLPIRAIAKNKAYREKKADAKTFNGLCDLYFKGMKPLYARFAELSQEIEDK